MEELDAVWEEMLAAAARRPAAARPSIVNDFIELKTTNDHLRQTAIDWLFETARAIAEHANLKNARVAIETADAHRFAYQNATLSGPVVRFRQGVRCLSLEAGWTRAPGDGFMRGNALAVARLAHFGMSKRNADLLLVKFENEPRWFVAGADRERISFEIEDLIEHFRIFLGAA